jgi:hypothetical protein
MPTPALKGRKPLNREEESDDDEEVVSIDEAERTLDEIISSADDAGSRIRRVLEQSRLERLERSSLSPPDTRTIRSRETSADSAGGDITVEDGEDRIKAEISVWGEKSFFRRMARKAPGGWAFTPQPKFGRTVDLIEEEEEERPKDIIDNKEIVKVKLCKGNWVNGRYLGRKHTGGSSGEDDGKEQSNRRMSHLQIHNNNPHHQNPLQLIKQHHPHPPPEIPNHLPQNVNHHSLL